MGEPEVRTTSSRLVYENPWMRLREDEFVRADGSRGLYGVVDKPDFAIVVPMDDGGFRLVEQYRYPAGGRFWEFPQGTWRTSRTRTGGRRPRRAGGGDRASGRRRCAGRERSTSATASPASAGTSSWRPA